MNYAVAAARSVILRMQLAREGKISFALEKNHLFADAAIDRVGCGTVGMETQLSAIAEISQ
ncbi:hypothetical protein HFO05_30270 [Rhizobium laguerreae]|uniref:hypothetical protein n=1 Tax=Rhizobium laguerreae TaxID=1076926 RepID=UPI001C8FF0EE|nr:hypothetical protein [Rhizobium laguerreae]MBY3272824.1 hypothetical protein [Rhizobium laguerreae]